MKTKNQLKRFRKRMQNSFQSFLVSTQRHFYVEFLDYVSQVNDSYKRYSKRMLFVTLGFVIFNIIVLLLNLYILAN